MIDGGLEPIAESEVDQNLQRNLKLVSGRARVGHESGRVCGELFFLEILAFTKVK